MMTLIKVKGLSPDKIPAIHAEIEYLRQEAKRIVCEHPIAVKFRECVVVSAIHEANDLRDEWIRGKEEELADEEEAGSKSEEHIQALRAELAEKPKEFPAEIQLGVGDATSVNDLRVLKCFLTPEGDYEIEVQLCPVVVEIRARFLDFRKKGGEFYHCNEGKAYRLEFNPGEILYARLFQLLGLLLDKASPEIGTGVATKYSVFKESNLN